ncbi:unnamed protein product (macronuclear) [Paramecium tetraurelia]|uniref:Uncharacterized protein n=1 Tax=Paramecium tetraurelia TaxID=5888 RepID=A0D1B3_PARTE|nr:uncharacterized protein GSPATT00012354001 [Paramecium tetraurelia]CAK76830.1 unnamed protein product [Paramecium tetraurelia]|eukprot:XP_001444227.1 hypothetical protein (macronuclear) [Paramecium tetraurelia strain d4-2]
MQHPRSTSAHYNTCNSQYGNGWLLHDGKQQVKLSETPVPTYAEIVRSMQDFRRAEKLIKNKLVAQQFGLEQQKKETEEEKQRRKIDSKVPPKPFPVKESEYTKPAQGINVGSPIYETSNMQYGQLNPTKFELIEKFYPRDAKFTQGFQGHTYKFDGLTTSVAFSKTHKALDEY